MVVHAQATCSYLSHQHTSSVCLYFEREASSEYGWEGTSDPRVSKTPLTNMYHTSYYKGIKFLMKVLSNSRVEITSLKQESSSLSWEQKTQTTLWKVEEEYRLTT